MLDKLYQILNELNEAILYAELNDMAYTKYYTSLLRQRRVIRKTIRKLEKMEKRLMKC